jgi:hypothetical protein
LKHSKWLFGSAALLLLSTVALISCRQKPGKVQDEAMLAERTAASLAAADEDYFHDMDGGLTLTSDEVKGRNTWNVWSGGNDKFWDQISRTSYGALDLLKTISSYPKLKFSRDNRWNYLGLVNEPCFDKATGPDSNRFGLWLDKRRSDCPADPFENESKYPGVKVGARGKNVPVGSLYGYATGVLGLRLFPNPDFDDAAAKKWDPKRYYEDPSYYLSKDLVKPYRVGMSCGFCHISAHPLRPPADPENPKFENLSSTVGAQYFWIDRIFAWDADASSFTFQLFHTSRPGALDTSLVASDNINNPRTMNAVYYLGPRLQVAKRWGKETLSGGGLNNKQFNDYVQSGLLTTFFQAPNTVYTPRVLKDGADSVGALGALNRVFLNIGLFSEEWMTHFNPLIGGRAQTPIEIAVAEKNSAYWQATEMQSPAMAAFFLKATDPHHLKDAPGGDKYLTKDQAQLNRGKVVFADYCARCHSSKGPTPAQGIDPGGCAGSQYLDCWNRYFAWTMTEDFRTKMRAIVQAADFLQDNYLSTDLRVPVTLLETNACSPLATNAVAGQVWDNFSSQSYKDLPSVGAITVQNPFTGERKQFQMPGGGRGYTRPPSLISVWSTAPFFVNNALGKFNPSPSVEARVQSFEDSIEKLLWPEKREKDSLLPDKLDGVVDRTTQTSYLRMPKGYLPDFLQPLVEPGDKLFPSVLADTGVQIGPIPAGTPVNLLANLELVPDDPSKRLDHDKKLLYLILKIKHDLKSLPPNATDDQARQVFANLADPLVGLSKCPDFVVNRGHYFGTKLDKTGEAPLNDSDKHALIEFLKTF